MSRAKTWSTEQLALLGTDTDKAIAERLGKKPATVTRARMDLGIPAFNQLKANQHKWTDEEISWLGSIPDVEIAGRLGISRNAVINARNMRGISQCPESRKNAQRGERPRVSITIRLPAELIERLREGGNVTAQIEASVKGFLQNS